MAAAQLDALPPSKRKKLRYEADWLQITPGERAHVVAGGGKLIAIPWEARLEYSIFTGKIRRNKWRHPTYTD